MRRRRSLNHVLKSLAQISSPVRGVSVVCSSSAWWPWLSRGMAARPARAVPSSPSRVSRRIRNMRALSMLDASLKALGGSQCAPCNRRTSTKWCPTCTIPTQQPSQSATSACIVAPWHVSIFVTPEKHLYPHDCDGTEPSQYTAPANFAHPKARL